MRATIRDLIIAEPTLTAVIPPLRWFEAGAVIDVPAKPFAVLRWISPVAGDAKGSFAHQFQVQIFDNRGSYKRIEEILGGPYRTGGVHEILAGIADVTGSDGRVTQADFLGYSGDDVDINTKSNTKYSMWQIIGRAF